MSVVLISGCSSGFGALCAREFATAGDQVIATMRDPEQTVPAPQRFLDTRTPDLQTPDTQSPDPQKLNVPAIDVRALDVTSADSIAACVSSVLADYGRIDVLINNAGIHLLGAIEDMEEARFRQVFETNFFGAVNLARAVLPSMRERRHGHIISVSSIGARVGRVMDGAYCASKAALETALEAMKYEVERFGIKVSVVSPGAFKTAIGDKLEMPQTTQASGAESPYHDLAAFRYGKVRESVAAGDDPAAVARLIRAIATDPAPGFRYLAGERAMQMDEMLAGLDDAARSAWVTRMAGIDWWQAGAASPTQPGIAEPRPAGPRRSEPGTLNDSVGDKNDNG